MPSLSPRRSRSTRRPKHSRQKVALSSVLVRASPTFRRPAISLTPPLRPAGTRRITATPPQVGCPSSSRPLRPRPAATAAIRSIPPRCLITNGGKQAIYAAFAVMLDPGDEVIVPAPYWTTYPEAIQLAGGVAVDVLADETQDYKVTVEQLEAARTERTKVLLFVSPSNPTGAVYTSAEIKAIGAWVEEHGLWVLTDEIYEHLVYDGVETGSMPVLCPQLADNCVIVNGVAKTYAMTGWRVGWMIGPVDLIKAATNLQSHATSNVANVSQRAAIAAVTGDLTAVEQMKVAFDRRRQTMVSMLNEIPGVVCPTPQGAFYAYPSVKGLLGKPIAGADGAVATTSAELAEMILERAEVAVVPGEAFGSPGYLRLSYALGDADLAEGVARMQKLLA